MERLTEKHYLGTDHYMKCSGNCNMDMDCIDCPSFDRLVELLAAYEDTGLTPEEVLPKDKADEIALQLMRLADLESLCNYTRLRELAEADKDGRVVVLPCKVGDTVWVILDGAKCVRRCVVEYATIGRYFTVIVFYTADRTREQYGVPAGAFGKTVFLAREEAEKALEEMKDD